MTITTTETETKNQHMKIIGQSNDDFVIVASKTEVARLVGFYSEHSGCKLYPGLEIPVNPMFDQLYAIKDIRGAIKSIRDAAAHLAKALETKMPIIEPIIGAIDKTMHQ